MQTYERTTEDGYQDQNGQLVSYPTPSSEVNTGPMRQLPPVPTGTSRRRRSVSTAPAPAPAPEPEQPKTKKEKKEPEGWLATFLFAVNKPWLLLTIPALFGAVWLANNTWIITRNLDKPYLLLAGPTFVASLFALWLVFAFFKTIVAWCKAIWASFQVWRKQDGAIFWMVIIIFLVVSVAEAGTFFNQMLQGNDLFGILGYAIAGIIDLTAVMSMRARLAATRLHDQGGANLHLMIITLCAGMSAFANVYTALDHYHELPWFMHTFAPWTSIVVPSLIIALSFAAEYTADQGTNKLDPEKFREQEERRNKYLEYKRDALARRVNLQKEMQALHDQLHPEQAAREAARERGRTEKVRLRAQREFFLFAWFFPVRQQPLPVPAPAQTNAPAAEPKKNKPTGEQDEQEASTSEDKTPEDRYDPQKLIQHIGGKQYYTIKRAEEIWNRSADAMRQLSKDGPEDVKAFFLTYKPDTLKALLVSTDLAAEERICALITEKRPYSATAKTPATKAGARTKKKVPTGELTKA